MLYCCTALFTVLVKEDRVIDMPNMIPLWIMTKYKVGWVEEVKSEMLSDMFCNFYCSHIILSILTKELNAACVCDLIFTAANFNSAVVRLVNVTKSLHMEISWIIFGLKCCSRGIDLCMLFCD
jgi:hypothetical protein